MSDPFCAFWFRVVAPHRGFLAGAAPAARKHLWQMSKPALVARTWEILCRAAIPALATQQPDNSTTEPLTHWQPASRWWHGAAPEWDVVSTSMDGRQGAVGEVKWGETPFDDAAINRLVRSMASRPLPPGLPPDVKRFVFVPSVSSNTATTNEGVEIITATQVFAALR
jgi:hypothetical protein